MKTFSINLLSLVLTFHIINLNLFSHDFAEATHISYKMKIYNIKQDLRMKRIRRTTLPKDKNCTSAKDYAKKLRKSISKILFLNQTISNQRIAPTGEIMEGLSVSIKLHFLHSKVRMQK